jgi:hypothetical protein
VSSADLAVGVGWLGIVLVLVITVAGKMSSSVCCL